MSAAFERFARLRKENLGWALGAGCVALLPALAAQAAVVGVSASSYTISFDSGFGLIDTFGPAPIPAWPPAITYNVVDVVGNNVAAGTAGAATYFDPFLAGLGFAFGTGVSQDWVDGAHTAATLRVDFSATYDVLGGFGPDTFSFANFVLGGQVSTGGQVSFTYGATFTGSNPAGAILGGTLGGSYVNTTPGAFVAPLFEFHQNGNFVAGNGTIDLSGFIEFSAYDGQNHSTSSISFTRDSGMAPIPLPAAAPLLASVLGLLTLLGWRRRGV